ncbi:Diphthamide biosynthesis protein 2 [Zalaria obscura]|uniref:Diphthamide biosynthesis protein 2 n=1 Tax=Zalaria obscura TaxID=2024903 RepID=A0ACC3SLM2_9PEZI
MVTSAPAVAPVLSTPDTHVFEDPTPPIDTAALPKLDDEQLYLQYEIKRTIEEIRGGGWKRIALQFPDDMLMDAPRVYEALRDGLGNKRKSEGTANGAKHAEERVVYGRVEELEQDVQKLELEHAKGGNQGRDQEEEKLCILADTSYGACCVDEVAAEHVDAQVVVHYGRSCLSPTARLPVIYVFTTKPLDLDAVAATFQETYPDKDAKVILMADIPYSSHIKAFYSKLQATGYTNIFATDIIHNPSSALPNRTVPAEVESDAETLRQYSLFHISEPPSSLLLIVSSRVASVQIYPTGSTDNQALPVSTAMTLRRRYALVTRLSTASIFGILVNTLSVANYLSALSHVQDVIKRAGKKSYTFVVGKVNAAKVANFSEVDGWVVIGCWESSLIESKDFWKPIITPWELELALTDERERVWTGEWMGDFMSVLRKEKKDVEEEGMDADRTVGEGEAEPEAEAEANGEGDWDDESDSEPPVFDLRTGRYVSQSRPMARARPSRDTKSGPGQAKVAQSLIKRANGDLAQIGGEVSPAAEFLRSKRTWQGLGSDYEIAYEYDDDGKVKGAQMEEGRSGIARGYVVGDDPSKA